MIATHFNLIAGWIIYCFLHSALAVERVKVFSSRHLCLGPRKYRLLYNLFALLGLALLVWMQVKTDSILVFRSSMFTNIMSVAVITFGIAVMAICVAKYFGQMSGLAAKKTAHLEVTGIHRYSRHPLYAGTFIFLIGCSFLFPYLSSFLSVAIIIIYTLIGIRFEERKLLVKFGDPYLHYCRNTPMLFPWPGKKK